MASERSVRRRTASIRVIARLIMRKSTSGSLVYIEDAEGYVALVQPRRAPGFWTFPGGFHRRFPREEPAAAAVREVKEELNLQLPAPPHPLIIHRQAGRTHYDHLFSASLDEPQPVIRRQRRLLTWIEISEVKWVDLSQPEEWSKLVHEAQVALRNFNEQLELGLQGV